MLVAIAIFSIISLSIFAAFAAGMKLNARSERSLKAYGDALIALEKMTREIENMVAYDFSGSYPGKKDVSAQPGSIEFLLAAADGLKAVRYALRPAEETTVRGTTIGQTTDKNVQVKNVILKEAPLMVLVRQERDFVDFLREGFEPGHDEILSKIVVDGGLTFRFARKSAGELSWVESPPDSDLPIGVRIELTLAPEGSKRGEYKFSRDVLVPTGSLGAGN